MSTSPNPPLPIRAKIIWGAEPIAKRIGTSGDFVRDTLVKQEGSPVRKIGGRYCAIEAELIAYFGPKLVQPKEP